MWILVNLKQIKQNQNIFFKCLRNFFYIFHFISKKSYLKHRGSKSIINFLNFCIIWSNKINWKSMTNFGFLKKIKIKMQKKSSFLSLFVLSNSLITYSLLFSSNIFFLFAFCSSFYSAKIFFSHNFSSLFSIFHGDWFFFAFISLTENIFFFFFQKENSKKTKT